MAPPRHCPRRHPRRSAVTCRIGLPFRLVSNDRPKGADRDEPTGEIMTTLAAMLPPQSGGVCADHSRQRERPARAADVAAVLA